MQKIWVAVISAKNHKRQCRKRQSVTAKREKSQTPKVLPAILTLPNLTKPNLTQPIRTLTFATFLVWRLRRWRLWFLALSNAPQNFNQTAYKGTIPTRNL